MCAEIFRRSAQQLKITHCWKRSQGHSQNCSYISESIVAMKIRPFVSYIKWPGELGTNGCMFIACSLPFVRLIQQSHFLQNCTLLFPWNLSYFLLAWVCYTADCNVLTLWWLSCSSTLPKFLPQTKDGPYLNLNLVSMRYLYWHMRQPAEITACELTVDRSLNTAHIISINLANWEMQCLKVHHTLSLLLIHTRFDDVTQLRRWNKFRGLRVDW